MRRKIIFTEAQIAEMTHAYESGSSFNDLAKSRGVSKNTVRRALLEVGVLPDVSRSIQQKAVGRPSARKGTTWSEETRAKFMANRAKAPWGGRRGPHSEETKRRISVATKGKNVKRSPEERKAIEKVRQACKRFVRRVLEATGKRKNIPSSRILGYSTEALVTHLGPRSEGDHIDHLVPIVEFLRRGITDPAVINALPNLRFMNGADNRKKSASVPDDADEIVASCVEAARFANGRPTYHKGILS